MKTLIKNIIIVAVSLVGSYLASYCLINYVGVDLKDDTYKYYFSSLAQVYGTLLAGVLIFIVFRYENSKEAYNESKRNLKTYISNLERQYNINQYDPSLNISEFYRKNYLDKMTNRDDKKLCTDALFWDTLLYRHRYYKNLRDDSESCAIINKRYESLPAFNVEVPWPCGGGIPPTFEDGSGFEVRTKHINEQRDELSTHTTTFNAAITRIASWHIDIMPILKNISFCIAYFVILLVFCAFLNITLIFSVMIYSTILLPISLSQLIECIRKVINKQIGE